MSMIEEGSKNQIGGEGASFPPTTVKEPHGALRSSVSPPPATTGTPITRRPLPSPPPTPSQVEEGHATAMQESVERCRTAKAKSHFQLGGMIAVFAFAVLSSWLCLPMDGKHPIDVGITFSLLLIFATFLSGKMLMLLNLHMLERLENLVVSGGQCVVSKCLIVVCTVLPVITLVSLLALLPSILYLCIGLTVITAVVLPVVAAYYYLRLRRRAEGGDKEELDAAPKITSCFTNSAFGGLIGVLFSAPESKQGFGATEAIYTFIFIMFATAIFGMLVMTVSKNA